MSSIALLAERRIREAISKGLLDDLPLKGKPIPRDDLAGVPDELRMGYKVLRDAGYLPEELQLHQEIVSLRTMLEACREEDSQPEIRRKLSLKRLQYDILMEKRGVAPGGLPYQTRLMEKLTGECSAPVEDESVRTSAEPAVVDSRSTS